MKKKTQQHSGYWSGGHWYGPYKTVSYSGGSVKVKFKAAPNAVKYFVSTDADCTKI